MSVRWEEEALRLAKLARLDLSPDEAAALARACEAITAEFAALADYATPLPSADERAAAPPREDEARPAPAGEADAILAQAPKHDPATRAVRVPRGLP